jgi:DNA-binding response OmpR family regulator
MSVRITRVSSPGVNDSAGSGDSRDARPSPEHTEQSRPAGGSILIVDDDEGVTQTFARMLRLEGYQVHTAISAEIGLQQAELSRPDAIILDLRMPLLDGLGFLRRLRAIAQQRETPVAIVTGDYFLDESVSSELQQLGAEVKFKPIWLEDLVALARTLLKVAH